MQTPLYKHLKSNGTSFYAFPGAAEDISAAYQSDNYKMYFSKYVLLDLPKKNITNPGGSSSTPIYFDFGTASGMHTISPGFAPDYKDAVIESLRNYVANHEVSLRESRLNNTEYYYDTRALETTSEKIFWKWCKKLNLIGFEPAIPQDEYFDNLSEFDRVNLTDDSYFPEYLWKEREVVTWDVGSYSQSTTTPGYLELETDAITNFRVGDIIDLVDFFGLLVDYMFGIGNDWVNGVKSATILSISTVGQKQFIVVDIPTSLSYVSGNTGTIKLNYHRLIRYIGEVNGVSNVQEANRAYTEVYAHIPDHTGETPDILFRTIADVNYKPGLAFPIIPSQYQPEIIGAELFSSTIVSNPLDYPGDHYGRFDTIDFTYETADGDTLRRSGQYYGVSGDINTPVVSGSTIDGITVDFNTSHYAKMNIVDREVSTFDEFNALEVDNAPPIDFEFNAILWYYTVEDLNGNRKTNLYGISFLDNPDNNPKTEEISIRFPVYKKLVTNGSQDGTSYAFGLNLNFNIIHDNPQEAYNPQAINSLFSMNLFNEAMSRLAYLNDSFLEVLGDHAGLQSEILNIKQLLYSQTDLSIINSKISNLEELLKSYSTQQIISSDTIDVEILDSSPSQLRLNNVDRNYYSIDTFNTGDMYNINGAIPVNINPPNNKNFLVSVVNNDEVNVVLPNNDKLVVLFTSDLSFRQSVDILISGSELSTQNKKMDIFITTINPINGTQSDSLVPVETLIIGDINLPIFFNSSTSQPNSASTWKSFNFNIDFAKNITLISGNFLQMDLEENSLIINNSIKPGDTLILNNLFVGTTSVFDFSGQYTVETVSGTTISLDVNSNIDFVAYGQGSLPLTIHDPLNSTPASLLSNNPYLSLNKGNFIRITRISDEDNIPLSQKYLIDIRDSQY